jgi:hypothetical protein
MRDPFPRAASGLAPCRPSLLLFPRWRQPHHCQRWSGGAQYDDVCCPQAQSSVASQGGSPKSGGGCRARRGEGWVHCGGAVVLWVGSWHIRSLPGAGWPRQRICVAAACWPPWDAEEAAPEHNSVPLVDGVLWSGGYASVMGLDPRSGDGGQTRALLASHRWLCRCGGVSSIVWLFFATRMRGSRSSGSGSIWWWFPACGHADGGVGNRGDNGTMVPGRWCGGVHHCVRYCGVLHVDAGVAAPVIWFFSCYASRHMGGEACCHGRRCRPSR